MIHAFLSRFAALFAPERPESGYHRYLPLLLLLIVAVGAGLRFWGLGAVGLHGDEETMAMPTQHIVEHGTPILPSGMFYPRALGQLYLMAASVAAFGETEWALRLPSALCGVLLIVLAWFAGRRFLTPPWNLAFAAAVALLPEFIIDAQTARMYVFLVTSIAGFLVLLFEWERTSRPGFLLGAVLMLLVGLQFHTLAVFSAPLLLFPGLLHGDLRKFRAGLIAFAIVVAGFFAVDAWIASNYPPPEQVAGFEEPSQGSKARWAVPDVNPWWIAVALALATGLATFVVRPVRGRTGLIAGGLLGLGLVMQTVFAYHIAALLIIAGLILAQRSGRLPPRRVAVLAGVCAVLALAQMAMIQAQGVGSLRQSLGAMTGWPSVWPYLVVSGYSIAAAVLVAVALLRALWCVAQRRRVPDHVLFVVLGVWLPLFLIGVFTWDIPLRYAAGQSLPLFLAAFAAAQWLFQMRWPAFERLRAPAATAFAGAIVCLVIVNPILVARTVNSGYAIHPDHKGAAEFMRTLELGPKDVILAEDILQQYYYLSGRVDYWLVASYVAAKFVRDVDGEPREIYLNAPVIGSGAELARLLEDPNRGTVYVIGSSEEIADRSTYFRGLGIQEVLDSPQFETIYRGRDGLTEIWKAPPPSLAARK
jgi:hypothetical protein